jgi:hypothetical protein
MPWKEEVPRKEIPLGMTSDVNFVPEKANEPTEVRPFPNETEVKNVQSLNAEFPIEVTPFGITIVFNLLPENADALMVATPLPSDIDVREAHP